MCLSEKYFCDRLWAASLYEHTKNESLIHDLVTRLKFSGEESIVPKLFEGDVSYLGLPPVSDEHRYDLILPLPLSLKRLRERGYNQSWLLAQKIADILKTPANPWMLEKVRDTKPQTLVSVEERRQHLRGAFVISKKHEKSIGGKSVLLVDDVYTTGSTMEEAAKILKRAGAVSVEGWVLARAD